MIVIARHSLSSSDLTRRIVAGKIIQASWIMTTGWRLVLSLLALDMAINIGYKIHLN
ncbi:hypothetical protein [uncultured Treponema sp.]|uniref:hypothetical protein n=1 Tax=uncultured Treponema sp. TaxID=162155 RepID=UPI0025D7FD19|nr:hypothetical protein [uncultured Treponema sp.]